MWHLIEVLKLAANREEKYCSLRNYTKPCLSSFQGCYKLDHRRSPATHFSAELNLMFPAYYILLYFITLISKTFPSLKQVLGNNFSSFTQLCCLKISKYRVPILFSFKAFLHSPFKVCFFAIKKKISGNKLPRLLVLKLVRVTLTRWNRKRKLGKSIH